MNTVKISLTFSFSFYSDGFVKYQCPLWPSLGSIARFDNYKSFEAKMNSFLQKNIKATLNYTESQYFMYPETLWSRQSENPRFGSALLNVPVNANLHSKLNQDKTDFPVTVHYIFFSEYEDFYVLWIPLIERFVQVKRSDDLAQQEEIIQDEIKKALFSYTKGDWKNVFFEAGRIKSFDVQNYTFSVEMPSLSDQLRQDDLKREISPSEIGLTQLRSNFMSSQIIGLDNQVERMNECLFLERPISVLIVGDPGVGKTTLWNLFAESTFRQNRSSCYSTTPIILGSNDENSDMGWRPDGRLEQIVAFAKKNGGVYYLGNLWELDQVGGYYKHPVSIADYLVPHLEKRELGVVVECNKEQFAELEKSKPGLIQLFDVIQLEPTNTESTNDILRKHAQNYSDVRISSDAISTITELYKRYSVYESLPGAAVKFLDLLISKNANRGKREIDKCDVIDFFTLQTGLPNFLLDPSIPFDKFEAQRFFTSRVIGQDGTSDADNPNDNDVNAVDTVVELLETVKSGLARQTGPIATLLFIGPTGVGKTEMAKALAEYLYSDPRRMIRLDMSEFSDPSSVDRLINGLDGGQGILTSQVRAQPFGVVLLDEFEKADPSVYDMFLQVMGEGRLTDSQGRLAVFTNCVIILTSNLGVDTFGKTSLAMRQSQQDSTQQHFTDAVAKLVRPELLNRIDRIVPFRALSKPVLRKILDLEFKSVNRRLGVRWRQLKISYDESVMDKLIDLGYNPQFGARPLRRTVEMYILHPLAEALAKKNPKYAYNVHFSFPEKKRHVAEDSIKPECLFTISVKTNSSNSDSNSQTAKSKETDEFLQKYRSFVEIVNYIYNCNFIERIQSNVIYQLQQPREKNKKKDKTAIELLSRFYQIRQKAMPLESDVVFDFLTAKEGVSQRITEAVKSRFESERDYRAVVNEWNCLLTDLYFYKNSISKQSRYTAYISGTNLASIAFFEYLLKTFIPANSCNTHYLLNRFAADIKLYLKDYCNGYQPSYYWTGEDGKVKAETSKEKLFQLYKSDELVYLKHEGESKVFESVTLKNDRFVDNKFVVETTDPSSVILLKALEGTHYFGKPDNDDETDNDKSKKGKAKRKTNFVQVIVFPSEECQKSLPNFDLNWNARIYQYRFSPPGFPSSFSSSNRGFYLTSPWGESGKISYDIDSIRDFFNRFILDFIYCDILEEEE